MQMKNQERYQELLDEYKSKYDNLNVQIMSARKHYYREFPDEKVKKEKKIKPNYDSLKILLELHGKEKLNNLIFHHDLPEYRVSFKHGTIQKKRGTRKPKQ